MSANTTKKWLKFFSDAGLPTGVATNYAMIFTEHRIQNDMLSDLTKEILYDMGIKTMGDVIAILRHAKSVTHNKTRDQLLGSELESSEETTSRAAVKPEAQRTLTHRFKTVSAPDSTQNSKSVGLKRTAETSGLISTNPKVRRHVLNADQEVSEDSDDSPQTSAKSSIFARLGAEKGSANNNSSIFDRLGGTVATDSVATRRRVTIGNSIDTSVQNRNLISFDSNNTRLSVTKPIAKKPILPPTPAMRSSGQTDSVSIKNRIGVIRTSRPTTIATAKRVVVNTSVNNRLAMNRVNSSGPSQVVAQAKRMAMIREVNAVNSNKNTTISLRKNIFDRLGPMSL